MECEGAKPSVKRVRQSSGALDARKRDTRTITLLVPRCFQWNAERRGTNVMGFPNPNGIASFSPGLRGTSYPGVMAHKNPTLKGLFQMRVSGILLHATIAR
jgi:hypothetical protein